MGKLRVMNRTGDRAITWDQEKVEVGDPEAIAAIKEVERLFEENRVNGGAAFKVHADKTTERIDAVDRTANEIILVPRIVGG